MQLTKMSVLLVLLFLGIPVQGVCAETLQLLESHSLEGCWGKSVEHSALQVGVRGENTTLGAQGASGQSFGAREAFELDGCARLSATVICNATHCGDAKAVFSDFGNTCVGSSQPLAKNESFVSSCSSPYVRGSFGIIAMASSVGGNPWIGQSGVGCPSCEYMTMPMNAQWFPSAKHSIQVELKEAVSQGYALFGLPQGYDGNVSAEIVFWPESSAKEVEGRLFLVPIGWDESAGLNYVEESSPAAIIADFNGEAFIADVSEIVNEAIADGKTGQGFIIAYAGEKNFIELGTAHGAWSPLNSPPSLSLSALPEYISFASSPYAFDINVFDAEGDDMAVLVWSGTGCGDKNKIIGSFSADVNSASFSIGLDFPDGNYAISFDVNDGVNFVEKCTPVFMADSTAPLLIADYNSAWQSNDVNVLAGCDDHSAGYGSGCTGMNSTFVSVSAEGETSLAFFAEDRAGNRADLNVVVMVDKTAPSLSIASPLEGSEIEGRSATLSFAADDNVSAILKFLVSADGNNWLDNGTSLSYTFTGQEYGQHTYFARAYDLAGNYTDVNVSVLLVEGAAPELPSAVTPAPVAPAPIAPSFGGGGGGGGSLNRMCYAPAVICKGNETCDGRTAWVDAKKGVCCMGKCGEGEISAEGAHQGAEPNPWESIEAARSLLLVVGERLNFCAELEAWILEDYNRAKMLVGEAELIADKNAALAIEKAELARELLREIYSVLLELCDEQKIELEDLNKAVFVEAGETDENKALENVREGKGMGVPWWALLSVVPFIALAFARSRKKKAVQ